MVEFQCSEEKESIDMNQLIKTRVLNALDYLCWLFFYYKVFALNWFCLYLYYSFLVEVKPLYVSPLGNIICPMYKDLLLPAKLQ